MTGCERQGSGGPARLVFYFYDELEPRERSAVERHLQSCTECRRAFEELSMIRSALAAMPSIDAPPSGDWTAFMRRLNEAVRPAVIDDPRARRVIPMVRARAGVRYAPYLTMAALLTLVMSGVVYVARSTSRPPSSSPSSIGARATVPQGSPPEPAPVAAERSAEAAFAALSEQHFERSKLVVLGLANKDPHRAREADWAYERGLASNLLSDTRLYRLAAEARGMKTLAGVMGDLEIVLLQTSLADAPDAGALEQIQRLIHKRDLVTKMDVASTTGS
jgi:anti-sigma factor RsiW